MSTTYKVTATKENLPRASGKVGICARHGIMPIQNQNQGKSSGLTVRNVTAPVRAKLPAVSNAQRTALKEIHNRTDDSKVGAICKQVTNITLRPKVQGRTLKLLQDKVQKPQDKAHKSLQEKFEKPVQDKVQKPFQDKVQKPIQEKVQKPLQEKVQKPLQEKTQESVLHDKQKDLEKKQASKVLLDDERAVCKQTTEAVSLVQPEQQSYSASLLPAEVEDIDRADEGNLILVTNYIDDIYKYLRELQVKYPIDCDHLKGSLVTPKMRSILINWLVEIHCEFRLLAETLYLTVAIIDRFLQVDKGVNQKNLQLVGSTAMLLASKYEEMLPPDIADFVYISNHSFTKRDIMSMEFTILKALNFDLGRPLPIHFLRRFSKAAYATTELHTLAKYCLELSLVEYSMSHLPPSLVAAAALYTALHTLLPGDKCLWTSTVQHYTQHCEAEVLPVARKMAALVIAAPSNKFQAVRNKYASSKFDKISMRPDLARLNALASS